ncbi:MAG: ZIP family metal transporter [Lachnospiraceae bacterium]|nr:ZIP family metal transporter [Lachnospiraceae bacterium]
MNWFIHLHPVGQGLLATLFTYSVTMLGAALVFFFKSVNQKLMDLMMGFAAGVMIAASYWSLLNPAIELSKELGRNPALHAAAGFAGGGVFIMLSDYLLNRKKSCKDRGEGWLRCVLVSTAVTIHNIPEGMAVGVAFGSAATSGGGASLVGAVMLAVGIGIQNFPEGTCVAMPLRREGMSRFKSFLIGQFSGLVEPIAGVIGVLFALKVQMILPLVLSFSAGAMISVVCSELVPESFKDNKILATAGVMTGFVVMMVLDVVLG